MRKRLFVLILVMLIGQASISPVRARVLKANPAVDTSPYSLIDAVNALRASNGLAPYTINPILMSVAQVHAQFMAANGVSHYGAGGSTPWQRGLAAGYPLAGDLSLGGFYSENITAGNNKSVQDAVTEWQGDAPHLNTMLSSSLREIGAGVALVGDYVYYVIDCAQPTGSGQQQAYTPAAGGTQGNTPVAQPLVVNTIVPSTPQQDGRVVHIVKPGETLWLIAISYGRKINDLLRLNNLAAGQSIHPGQVLLVGFEPTFTPLPPTASPTGLPTNTPPATEPSTSLPPQPTATALPVAPVASNQSLLVLAVIILAAIILALVFVRAARKE
jgi:LysM repeat protein